MSIPVAMTELAERIGEYGERAFLITVNDDGRPHVVSVVVGLDDTGQLTLGAGRRSSANIADRPDATLLWPAPAGGDYSLIVDGTGHGRDADTLAVEPGRAVLHRIAGAAGTGPSCITVLDR